MIYTDPTGKGIRVDLGGDGHYGAKRGKKKHRGLDFLCEPGQKVLSPLDSKFARIALPYEDDLQWSGVLLVCGAVAVKIFYLLPDVSLQGTWVQQGQVIGIAQDIREKYRPKDPGKPFHMRPHIHLELSIDGKRVNPEPFFFGDKHGS